MTWAEHHDRSEDFASQAELHMLQGQQDDAVRFYSLAADAEVRALHDLDAGKTRTLGVTAVSAVALLFRARRYAEAEELAYRWLSQSNQLPRFAYSELQSLLQLTWGARAQEDAGVSFIPGDVLVSVSGGRVVFGGAPLDLVIRKVEEVRAMFYRTAELLLGVPHRKRGLPSQDVQSVFQPWLFQAPRGSYQFAVRVQSPPQMEMFPEAELHVGNLVSTFLSLIRTSVEDPDGAFQQLVPNPDYQTTFLKLTRNLAPTGESFEQIQFRDAGRISSEPVALAQPARGHLNEALRARKRSVAPEDEGAVHQIRGVLRGVHLDKDWLEVVVVEPTEETVRIVGLDDVVDDIIGPMVNNEVIVTATVDAKGRLQYEDVEPVE